MWKWRTYVYVFADASVCADLWIEEKKWRVVQSHDEKVRRR